VQKRRLSGTLGSAISTEEGSAAFMGAISTIPAPTRLRRVVLPLAAVWREREVRRDTSTRPDTRPDPVTTRPEPVRPAGAADGAIPQVSQ
jgi:hypothetical protein